MGKRIKKIIISIMAFGMLFAGIMATPVEAGSTCRFTIPIGGGTMWCSITRSGNNGVDQHAL